MDVQTDTDMTKLIVAFRSFANAIKILFADLDINAVNCELLVARQPQPSVMSDSTNKCFI
jgi:hypothetical protein